MTEPATAVVTLVLLGLWHLSNRRHPGWQVSADGRFFILSGYPTLMIAVYWLTTAPSNTRVTTAVAGSVIEPPLLVKASHDGRPCRRRIYHSAGTTLFGHVEKRLRTQWPLLC
ncbi:hypothetical protein [Mycolicibacterium monacense]|uniref:hypothetical protein n=1 Tax=Mycolicibacterium monacense TaxID=85693 RepID=UPI0009EF2CD5|nr:hypothetical protein [Mycolicibacterium monacense]